MTRVRVACCAVAVVAVALAPAVAHAEPEPPAVGSACPADQVDAMTLLPDEQTYVRCQEQFGSASSWVAVQTPFEPNDVWLSYGPAITLHGQGMRNPNLSSGQWTATPLDPETVCSVTQTTVVEAGVLAEPVVSKGEQGESLSAQMLPRLFYAELAGDCLWVKD